MKNKSDKFLYMCMIPTCAILAIFFMFIAVTAKHGTQYLEEEKIKHYATVANNIWNSEENSVKDSSLQYKITDKSITVYSYNMFEQTVTVFFTEEGNNVVVNEPNINFTGCCIFFSWLAAISLVGAITFISVTIEEFRYSKWKKKFSAFYIK